MSIMREFTTSNFFACHTRALAAFTPASTSDVAIPQFRMVRLPDDNNSLSPHMDHRLVD